MYPTVQTPAPAKVKGVEKTYFIADIFVNLLKHFLYVSERFKKRTGCLY
jgi:hypothetical protein